jgi:hypothetical protein
MAWLLLEVRVYVNTRQMTCVCSFVCTRRLISVANVHGTSTVDRIDLARFVGWRVKGCNFYDVLYHTRSYPKIRSPDFTDKIGPNSGFCHQQGTTT